MKTSKITLILTITGILILTLISQTPNTKTATIKEIKQTNYKTIIKLQNHSTELIIFETPNLNLTPGNKIKFQGKEDTYKNQKQIIVSKISRVQ